MPTFDTLTFAKKMQEAGFTAQQAEAQAEALRNFVESNLASSHDIELVRREMKELDGAFRDEIEFAWREIKELEGRIVIRLGALVVVAVTLLGVVLGILIWVS